MDIGRDRHPDASAGVEASESEDEMTTRQLMRLAILTNSWWDEGDRWDECPDCISQADRAEQRETRAAIEALCVKIAAKVKTK
mgnify:CR=1 FL=1